MEALGVTRGRRYLEKYSVRVSDPFEEDGLRIKRSSAFRRLGNKTQVFTAPEDSNVRTRLTHSLEVEGVATYISDNLGLNTTLCKAIAYGHDIGHAPYGHLGEKVLSKILGRQFRHSAASVVLAQHVESHGKGLNLSYETLEGILYHSRTGIRNLEAEPNLPVEYGVVMFADKIAFTSSDINDAIRVGFLQPDKLPDFIMKLGATQDERDFNVISALIEETKRTGWLKLTEGPVSDNFYKTREFMRKEVYRKMKRGLNEETLYRVYDFLSEEPRFQDVDPALGLLLLTDGECNQIGNTLMRHGKCSVEDLRSFSIFEYLQQFAGREIDITDADLGWGTGKEKVLII